MIADLLRACAALCALSASLSSCTRRAQPPTDQPTSGAHATLHRSDAAVALDAARDGGPTLCDDRRPCFSAALSQLGLDTTEARFEERPARVARLRAFAIDRDEVSSREYGRCVRAGACEAPTCERRANDGGVSDATTPEAADASLAESDEPVTCVRWSDARSFCEFVGGRLPTEAEWERAAAGALPAHRRFPWGEDSDGGFVDRTPEGVRALGGGVAEWVADVGAFYQAPAAPTARDAGGDAVFTDASAELDAAPDPIDREIGNASALEAMDASMAVVDDPHGPRTGAWRVIRGAHRDAPLARWTTTARTFRRPDDARPWLGFRCAYSHR